MATGEITLGSTFKDPAIRALADTLCDRCEAPLDCGPYETLLMRHDSAPDVSGATALMYLHPACGVAVRAAVARMPDLEAR